MSLKKLDLLVVTVPQRETFQSAIGVRNERLALFVKWTDYDGNWGIGESSCRPDPYFNGEFVNGAVNVIHDYIFPRLAKVATIEEIITVLSKVRNWPFTTSALLDAVFDLQRRKGEPDTLDSWQGSKLRKVPVGISLGLFKTPEAAVARVKSGVEEGYRRIKLKISPGMNLDTIAAIREAFPDFYIGFDANGSFTQNDFELLCKLAEFRPTMLEQPFAPRRIDLCSALKKEIPALKICLDESVTNIGDVVAAYHLKSLDEVNIKPGRVGGMPAALEILAYCNQKKIPAWVGGMFETGVGRLNNLRIAARIPNATAHDLSPSSRYFIHDIIEKPFKMDANGYIDLSNDSPVSLDEERLESFLKERIVLAGG